MGQWGGVRVKESTTKAGASSYTLSHVGIVNVRFITCYLCHLIIHRGLIFETYYTLSLISNDVTVVHLPEQTSNLIPV